MENKDFSKVFSYSKIGRFEKCALSYYFYYLDPQWKGFKKPRDYKTKGTAVHGALTLFYNLPLDQRNLKNLKKCLEDAWFSGIDPKKKPPLGDAGGFNNVERERRAYWEALKMLENFFKLGDVNPSLFYMPSKNIRYSFDEYEELVKPLNSEFLISGKFDRIDKLLDGTLRVIDFKTGSKEQDRFQLDFYKILAELNFNIPVNVVSFYYLKNEEIIDFATPDGRSQQIKQEILEKVSKIRNEKEFPPKPSALCSHCDFKEICPVFQ